MALRMLEQSRRPSAAVTATPKAQEPKTLVREATDMLDCSFTPFLPHFPPHPNFYPLKTCRKVQIYLLLL